MYLANYFDLKDERKKIIEYFDAIDYNKNGTLTFEELVRAYKHKVIFFN